MGLGLPLHLARNTVSRSFARGMRAAGFTCLAAAFLLAVVFQSARPADVLWPAMVAVLPMALLLWLSGRYPTALLSAAYIVVGAACVFWYIATFCGQSPTIVASDALPVSFVEISLVMVAGPRTGVGMRILWSTLGYAAATLASAWAFLTNGLPASFDVDTLLAFLLICILLFITSASRGRGRPTQPLLHRAARDEQLAAMRYRIEVKAAAMLHDTVLSHLAAIANSTPGALNPILSNEIKRDLELLLEGDWLSEETVDAVTESRLAWEASALFAAVQESRAAGLDIDVTGDFGVVGRLDREGCYALGLAAKQCLMNVLRHSGTTEAEVAIQGSDTEVSVMVIDAGRGFSEKETASDRLGLRNSVRRRIEGVGGTVQVWSTPGRGTTIMMRVPARPARPTAELTEAFDDRR